MARIKTYGLDTSIDSNDMWIGTDGGVGKDYATKNFTAGGFASWIVGQIDTGSLSIYTHPNHSGDVISNADLEQTLQSVAVSGKSTKADLLGTEEFLLSSGNILYKTSLSEISTFVETNVTSTGTPGPTGPDGADGLSAYEVAVADGFVGTQITWLASLTGATGNTGAAGPEGVAGTTGPTGPDGVQGIQGTQGTQGIQGTQGDQGAAGVVGLTYRGDYNVATTYVTSDVVRSTVDGNAYFLQTGPTTGAEPSTDSNWALFVMEGANGSQGAQGVQGVQGVQGEPGAEGVSVHGNHTGQITSAGLGSTALAVTAVTAQTLNTSALGSNQFIIEEAGSLFRVTGTSLATYINSQYTLPTNILVDTDTLTLVTTTNQLITETELVAAVANKHKIVSASTYTIRDEDLNYTLFFTNGGAVTVTVGTLSANFECDLWNTATAGTVTFAGSGITLESPEGFKLGANKVGACIRISSTSSYRLKGEFTI